MVVGIVALPTTTEFSSTADPVPTSTPAPCERITAPSASSDPSPRRAVPSTTAERAICGAPASASRNAVAGPALMRWANEAQSSPPLLLGMVINSCAKEL